MLSHFGGKAVAGDPRLERDLTCLVFRRELSRAAPGREPAPRAGRPRRARLGHRRPRRLHGVDRRQRALPRALHRRASCSSSASPRPPRPHQRPHRPEAAAPGRLLPGRPRHPRRPAGLVDRARARQPGTSALCCSAPCLTAFNDNALITYLATLVPDLARAAEVRGRRGRRDRRRADRDRQRPQPRRARRSSGRHFEDGISPRGPGGGRPRAHPAADAGVPHVVSGRDESVERFGYTQELRRSLGFLASFGIAFSYVSPVVGVYTLFGFGLASGGPAYSVVAAPGRGRAAPGRPRVQRGRGHVSPWPGPSTSGRGAWWGPRYGWFVGWTYGWALVITIAAVDFGAAPYLATLFGLAPGRGTLVLLAAGAARAPHRASTTSASRAPLSSPRSAWRWRSSPPW